MAVLRRAPSPQGSPGGRRLRVRRPDGDVGVRLRVGWSGGLEGAGEGVRLGEVGAAVVDGGDVGEVVVGVDGDSVGEVPEQGRVGHGVAVGGALGGGEAVAGAQFLGDADLVLGDEDSGGVEGAGERHRGEAGGDDVVEGEVEEAAGEEVGRHGDDGGVLAAGADGGADVGDAGHPGRGGVGGGDDVGGEVAPEPVDLGGEAAGVEGPAGEAGLEFAEFGEGAVVACDLQGGGGAGQEGAVHVEDVQVSHGS